VTRNTHCAPPSSRFTSHSPAPSQCFPIGADLKKPAVSLFVALILIPLNIHPRVLDKAGQFKSNMDSVILVLLVGFAVLDGKKQ
jgi:hypothetical protein